MAGATRRSQRREETLAEIRKLALDQVVAGGPDAVSLNAIAGEMGMSPAAIYRYFTNRDALVADLVVSFYDALADALEAVPDRLPEVARAYREWALANPNGYRLIFQTTSGSGIDLAPERTIPAASRSMVVILGALAGRPAHPPVDAATGGGAVGAAPVGAAPVGAAPVGAAPVGAAPVGAAPVGAAPVGAAPVGEPLARQLRDWAARTGLAEVPERVLALGLVCWTRLHGVVSLELGHHLTSTGVDPALLYEAEIHGLVATLAAP